MLHRLVLPSLVVLALLAGGPLTASAAKPKIKPSTGDYQSAPVIPANRDYSVGVFSVDRDGGKRWIVPTAGYLGIYYPDANECDDLMVPLAAATIRISSKGRFVHRERTPVATGNGFIKVRWKGRWTKPGVVSGSIKIKYGGCKSKRRWTGGKVIVAG